MAELKNSQRINYKATYVQLQLPTAQRAQPNGTAPPAAITRYRALEKTAFLQSLRITTQDLALLKEKAGTPALQAAVPTIEALVNDRTATSTLNNASRFAEVDPAILLDAARIIVSGRSARADAINGILAQIINAYQNRQPTGSAAGADPAGTVAASPATLPRGASIERTSNSLGIAIKRTVVPPAISSASTGSGIASVMQTGALSVDDSKPQTSSVIPSAVVPPGVARTSATKAIAWAETDQPKLFGDLHDAVSPYLSATATEMESVGKSTTIVNFLRGDFASYFNVHDATGTIAGFDSRRHIEPVGNLHLERIEMYPVGIERGELIHSIPLTPNETVNVSHKEWAVSQQEFEEIVQDFFEGYSEQGVAEKNDVAMSSESQSKHATALSVGASLSASYASVTLSASTNFNMSTNDDQSRKDSRNHSTDITKKASARTRKDHKVTFKVSSVTGSEDQSVRVITNPSDTDAMRVDYFQLARKWKMDLLRYGIRMTYDIVIPNPGSALTTKVQQLSALDAQINIPFSFTLPLNAITYDPFASDPSNISNYAQLAAEYDAVVTAPPEVEKWVSVHKEIPDVSDYDHVHYDSLEFAIDENYYINDISWESNYTNNKDDTQSIFKIIGATADLNSGIQELVGKSGKLSLDLVFQYVYKYAIHITFHCKPKSQVIEDWRLQVWNQLRQAAEDIYNKNLQSKKDLRAQLTEEIEGYDALTLRRMEQEEIMKGVLRWIFGPEFYLVPDDIASLFSNDSNDPEVTDVLDPNKLTDDEWMRVMEHGEFIKYIHNAIEWENVLYFTYPYFWDDAKLWDFKKFLYHPDPTHRVFLRSGAARVVLTIRPGFEPSFTQLVELGAFKSLPGPHPYVTIAQEIQDFANTNYPGFSPVNPEESVRPQLYLEQRRVWREMQYIIQLLQAFKTDSANKGLYPTTAQGLGVLAAYLTQVNTANTNSNAQALALDPTLSPSDLLPTYASVPVKDIWGYPYFYQSPGDTGDYDLISYGADGKPGGTDKNADISANVEASLIATWYEFTPTNALDIGITMNKPNVTPADVKPDIG